MITPVVIVFDEGRDRLLQVAGHIVGHLIYFSFRGAMVSFNNVGQLGICAEAVGTAQAALEMSLDYGRRRPVRGESMLQLLTIQSYIGEMASRIEVARWLTYRAAAVKDEGKSIRKEVAMAKLVASQTAVDVTSMAMQIHGSYGYTKDFQIERLYRDAKITQIYEVVSEIQRIIVASSLIA